MIRSDLNQFLPMARRHPFSTGCAIFCVVAGIAAWFLWQQVGELEAAHYVSSQEGERMLTMLVSGPLLRQELTYVHNYTRRIEEHLVVEDNRGDNFSYFYALEEQTKARITDLRQLTPPTPDSGASYKRIPYSLKVTGTYQQVASMLQAVETGTRLSSITAFSFRRLGPNSPLVSLDLTLVLLGKI
jgi:Pilus assembly protein, PilO